jgi:hypothetical protein
MQNLRLCRLRLITVLAAPIPGQARIPSMQTFRQNLKIILWEKVTFGSSISNVSVLIGAQVWVKMATTRGVEIIHFLSSFGCSAKGSTK